MMYSQVFFAPSKGTLMDKSPPKVLSLIDLSFFTVSAIVLLDTLAASASIGPSSLFWWLFLGAIFLVPIGLITAELGTAFPAEGGIYVWIRMAFGRHWAARAAWAYWVNTAIWLPAIYILFVGVSSQLFGLSFSLNTQIAIGIVLAWMTVLLDVVGMRIGKWVPNIGAMLKLIIFGVLIFMGYRYGSAHGLANEISVEALRPQWEEGLQYLPAIIYGMLGFELVSSAGEEIKNPRRSVPLAILISGALVLALYFFSTVGILAAIPAEEIDIVEGLIDTLNLFFADVPGGGAIVTLLGIGALFTFFSNGATWAMGCNRATAEAASEGQLPSIWAWRHPGHGGPVGAAVMMGIVCTLVLVLYGRLAQSNEDLFWTLFSFSAVIFMLPYVGMCFAFIALRVKAVNEPRPFKAPGGMPGAVMLAGACILVLCVTMFLFLFTPGEGFQYATLWGVLAVLAIGDVLLRLGMAEHRIRNRRKS